MPHSEFLPSAAAARTFSVSPSSEGFPKPARLALGFVTSAGYSENGEGGINPGDGTPTSSSGGRVTCMGIKDMPDMPVGDWLRGLELLLWAGVVRLDEARMSQCAFIDTASKHKAYKQSPKKKNPQNKRAKLVSHCSEVRRTERSAHEASAAEA